MHTATNHATEKGAPLEAALTYARRGWGIIPLHTPQENGACSCGTVACKNAGKHPRTRNGLKDATTDEATITTWWGIWPAANIGIATGAASGLIVLDVDPRNGGGETLEELEEKHGALPDTIEALTGGGGRHILFAHPGGRVQSGHGKLGAGLDIKADGGYIVAPPSLHASGRAYEWEASSHPEDGIALAQIPPWVKSPVQGVQKAPLQIPEVIFQGARNETLARLAGAIRRVGMTQGVIEETLEVVNRNYCDPPLSNDEVACVARSISRYAPEVPLSSSPPIRNRDGMMLRVTQLGEGPEPAPMAFVVEDFIPEHYPTMIFGDGGQGKSMVVMHLACCVAEGVSFLGRGVKKGGVLYVDFELDEAEQRRRAYKVARGLGLTAPPKGLYYFSPTLQEDAVGDLGAIIGELGAIIRQHNITLTIVDSFGAAVAGDPESAKDVTGFFRKLRQLGTVLILDHQAKGGAEKYRDKTAFGSVYKGNLTRNVWQLQRLGGGAAEDTVKLALYHKKSNFGPLRGDTFLTATFGEAFTLEAASADGAHRAAVVPPDAVYAAFVTLGQATAAEVAEVAGENLGTVKNRITALKRQGVLKDTGKKCGQAHIYEAVVTASHSFKGGDDDDDARLTGA